MPVAQSGVLPIAGGTVGSTFPIIDVSDWSVIDHESVGGDVKEWLDDPTGGTWLFKPRTERPDRVQGEDWAEKVTTEVAHSLGIPAARVELAARQGRRGTISANLRPDGWEQQHGDVLLAALLPGYEAKTRDRSGHNLANIAIVLEAMGPPTGEGAIADMTAFEVFSGYLVLDALVANRDRHEQNWAIHRPLPDQGASVLAGSYDHGSSLGFNLTDAKRKLELERRGVPGWATKATAQRFDRENDGRLTLVELARSALGRCRNVARGHWIARVDAVQPTLWEELIEQVPDLSDVTRTFVVELLAVNRRRFLDECQSTR